MLRHRLHCTIVRAGGCGAGACALPAARAGSSGQEQGQGPHEEQREWAVLNEVVIDRGISSFLGSLECFCDGAFVTHVQVGGAMASGENGGGRARPSGPV